MSDRIAATIGMVLAGVALAAGFLPWTTTGTLVVPGTGVLWSVVGVAFAAVALVAFALRRYGAIDRLSGAAFAIGASAAVVLAAALAVVFAVQQSLSVGVGVGLAALFGVGAIASAYLDASSVDGRGVYDRYRRGAVALLVGLAGLIGGNVIGALPIVAFPDMSTVVQYAVLTPLFGVGLGIVAYLFLSATDRGFDYIDVGMPDAEDVGYMVGGTLLIFVLLVALGLLSTLIGLPSTQSGIVEQAQQGNADILLVLIPLSWLVIGPGEELLFRGVIQKYLYGSFSRNGAVVVACAVFASMHALAYYSPDTVALTSTLVRLFFLSLVLGVAYERTENLVVPIFIHGTFNAVQFGLLYASLKYGMDLWLLAP